MNTDSASQRVFSDNLGRYRAVAWMLACLGLFVACSDGNPPTDSEPNSDSRGGQAGTTSTSSKGGGGGGGGAAGSAASHVSSAGSNEVGGGVAGGAGKSSTGSAGGASVGAGGKGAAPTGAGGARTGQGGASVDAGKASVGAGGLAVGKADAGKAEGGRVEAGAAVGGSTGTGGATGGDSGSSTGFQPCPQNGDPCKVLPLGDSITFGLQSSKGGGYRVELFTKAVQANQNITFTGTQTPNGPDTVAGKSFPKNHEGISGQTIDQIASRVPKPAYDTLPNIVLVMAGTNDVYASSGQSTMPDRLGTLIDKCVSGAPDALIAVATLTPLSNASWQSTLETYNAAIPGVVKKRADAGKHVIVVDMSKVTSSMLSDGVHPNDTGYSMMGDTWYDAIKQYLPAAK